jgi:head-tail adaptor
MRSGRLSRTVSLARECSTPLDDSGAPAEALANIQDVRIALIERPAERSTLANARSARSITFRMRWRQEVRLGLRIIFEDQVFEITSVQELGRRRAIECRAVCCSDRHLQARSSMR